MQIRILVFVLSVACSYRILQSSQIKKGDNFSPTFTFRRNFFDILGDRSETSSYENLFGWILEIDEDEDLTDVLLRGFLV